MTPTEHPIRIEPARNRWRAYFAGHVVADSDAALIVHEADLPSAVYFPRDDVAMEYFSASGATTHCPYKGEAARYTLLMDGQFAENGAWSYASPYPAAAQLAGYLAFEQAKVEVYEVDDAAVNPRHVEPRTVESLEVDEVVRHTDTGDGHSQAEHWRPNVETPNTDGGLR